MNSRLLDFRLDAPVAMMDTLTPVSSALYMCFHDYVYFIFLSSPEVITVPVLVLSDQLNKQWGRRATYMLNHIQMVPSYTWLDFGSFNLEWCKGDM